MDRGQVRKLKEGADFDDDHFLKSDSILKNIANYAKICRNSLKEDI